MLREGKSVQDEDKPEPEPTPEPEPEPTPTPPSGDFTEFATWSGEYTSGENVVWTYQTGIRFDDGTEERSNTTYIVIGNPNHTRFLRSNSNRGTIDISKELTGGDKDQKNVQVFATIEEASERADELTNPPERDPTDPVQPQPEPQPRPEDPNDRPSNPLPVQPDYGLGGGGSRLFSNGGM